MSEHKPVRSRGGNTKMPDGDFNLRSSLNFLLKVFYWGHRPLKLLGCKLGSVGWRSAGDWPSTLAALAVLVAWAAWTQSAALLYVGTGLAVLMELLHRTFPFKGHSRYFGDSWFERLVKGNLRGHLLTSGLAILTGLMLFQFSDKGLGSYLVFAGAGYATWALFLNAREKHMRQDQADAEYLSRALHEREEGR